MNNEQLRDIAEAWWISCFSWNTDSNGRVSAEESIVYCRSSTLSAPTKAELWLMVKDRVEEFYGNKTLEEYMLKMKPQSDHFILPLSRPFTFTTHLGELPLYESSKHAHF